MLVVDLALARDDAPLTQVRPDLPMTPREVVEGG
jgi:hypothetical protein